MSTLDNPKVNRSLKDKAMDHIDHALGRPLFPLGETYRDHFATDAGSEQAKLFEVSPHWERTARVGHLVFFTVTNAGRRALADHLRNVDPHRAYVVEFGSFSRIVPAKSRSAARYAYFCEVADSFSDLTFGQFAKKCTVRAHA